MRRTKGPLKYYIAMEYLPGKFGIVKGPYFSEHHALHVRANLHHCIICIGKDHSYLMYRKNTGKWKKEKKEISFPPRKKKRKRTK